MVGGGLKGKPKDEATQTHFKFLPIATSDFIFAYNIERFGFYGALLLLGLYGALITHLLSLNYGLKNDYFTQVTATGIAALIFVYVGVNVSMTIGFWACRCRFLATAEAALSPSWYFLGYYKIC